jgi:hypothetical protein
MGIADVESSLTTTRNASAADRICSSLENMRCGARTRFNLSIRKVAHEEGGAGGMGQAIWSGVARLSSSDYLDGVLGGFSLLVLFASKSIRFRALS